MVILHHELNIFIPTVDIHALFTITLLLYSRLSWIFFLTIEFTVSMQFNLLCEKTNLLQDLKILGIRSSV